MPHIQGLCVRKWITLFGKNKINMIKSIYIDNFKALNDFTISLKPFTVLIGKNACGKSTILQAINLMSNLVKMDIEEFIKDQNWSLEDLKSQLSDKKNITFRAVIALNLHDQEKKEEIEWEFVFTPVKKENKIYIRSEKITNKTKNRLILDVGSQGIQRYNAEKKEKELFPSLNLSASFIKNIDFKEKNKYPELVGLKRFLTESDNFGLLSPEKLARNSRGKADRIGTSGENIASFIHGLTDEHKEALNKRLKKYLSFMSKLFTKTKGKKWGWIEILASEQFQSVSTTIKAKHLSDGILRIIALCSLAELTKNNSIILLEEIENGINPHIVKILSEDLRELSENNGQQIILTTHSSVILDYFSEDSIILIWRDKNGRVYSSDMFKNEEIRSCLDYMYPGEIWINTDEDRIIESFFKKDNEL